MNYYPDDLHYEASSYCQECKGEECKHAPIFALFLFFGGKSSKADQNDCLALCRVLFFQICQPKCRQSGEPKLDPILSLVSEPGQIFCHLYKKMKELFPDGVIPKIKDLQDELDKANTEYGQGLYAENV